MEVQAIAQGRCTECGEDEDNYSIRERNLVHEEFDEEPDRDSLVIKADCQCGESVGVIIPDDNPDRSLTNDGSISWEDASWNQDSDD